MIGMASMLLAAALSRGAAPAPPGIVLGDLTWVEAEKVLTPETVVVIPLGAESKEHGPHLKLKNDFVMAEYLAKRVRERAKVVIAPTVNYSYYPAFVEYPGSTGLDLGTARDMVVEICRGLARFGPKRFYVLNTGVSTQAALEPAAAALAAEGILLRYTNVLTITEAVEKQVSKQEGGTHADEIETSMMLYMSPGDVDMSRAVKDYHPGQGPDPGPGEEGHGLFGLRRLWRPDPRDERERADRDGGAGRRHGQRDRGPPDGAAAGGLACCDAAGSLRSAAMRA